MLSVSGLVFAIQGFEFRGRGYARLGDSGGGDRSVRGIEREGVCLWVRVCERESVCARERKREKHLGDRCGGDRFGHIDCRSLPAVRPKLTGGGG